MSLHRSSLPFAPLFGLGLALAAAVTGCGDDNKGDPTAFIGSWKVTAGQFTPTCQGLPIPPASLADETITVTPGTDSALIATVRGCVVKLDIAGTTATAKPNQTCMLAVMFSGMNVSATLTIATGTFTVADKTATLAQSGMGTVSTPIPGVGASCPYQIAASATKTP
jgi:hypothetical protein